MPLARSDVSSHVSTSTKLIFTFSIKIMVLLNSTKPQLNILKKLSSKINRLKAILFQKPLMTIRMGEEIKKET